MVDLADLLPDHGPTLTCPKCKTVRTDIIITWEKSYEPGKLPLDKKTIRATIKTLYDADENNLIHVCGMCEHEWTEELDSEEVTSDDNHASAALAHLRKTHFGDPVTLDQEEHLLTENEWDRLIRE
jgi:hypothetical protein